MFIQDPRNFGDMSVFRPIATRPLPSSEGLQSGFSNTKIIYVMYDIIHFYCMMAT